MWDRGWMVKKKKQVLMLTAKEDRKDKLRAISTHQDVNLLHFCSLLHKLQ